MLAAARRPLPRIGIEYRPKARAKVRRPQPRPRAAFDTRTAWTSNVMFIPDQQDRPHGRSGREPRARISPISSRRSSRVINRGCKPFPVESDRFAASPRHELLRNSLRPVACRDIAASSALSSSSVCRAAVIGHNVAVRSWPHRSSDLVANWHNDANRRISSQSG